jgi:RNA polymerase sigma-70 factor (ECF subfamily)
MSDSLPPSSTDPSSTAPVPDDDAPPDELLSRVMNGDHQALAELFALYRPRLWRLVNFRLHPKLRGRVDADDLLQDAFLRAVDRQGSFLSEASRSPFLWFRMITMQTLLDLHRAHLGTEKRNATRETNFSGGGGGGFESTSCSLAAFLAGSFTSPSGAMQRAEMADQLDLVIQGMNEIDREVLALRHFEELTNGETAAALGLSEQAASVRYLRALRRLKEILKRFPSITGWPVK